MKKVIVVLVWGLFSATAVAGHVGFADQPELENKSSTHTVTQKIQVHAPVEVGILSNLQHL